MGGSSWNLSRGVVFSFYRWEKESEKNFHFIHQHNDNVEGLVSTVELTINEKAYRLVNKAYTLFVCYMCLRFLFVFVLCLFLFCVNFILELHMTMTFVGFF
jgi:hypothetical protein